MLFVLAMAAVVVPAMAYGASVGSGGVDILGEGIFETGGSAFQFPNGADTNFDSVNVGNDRAFAAGWIFSPFPPTFIGGPANAANNLEIKKNQDSGECECCQVLDPSCPCQDCCTKYNVEQITVGSRTAQAFGFANANNNVKIVTNQQ
jgi:hypothetical protein